MVKTIEELERHAFVDDEPIPRGEVVDVIDELEELRRLIDAVRTYDEKLDRLEEAPTGDDYNEIIRILGVAL